MLNGRVDIAVFTEKIKEYQHLTGKATGEVVKEQARLLAERLTKLTYPTSQKQGRKRVAIDIGRVYLANKWFTDIFRFKNAKLGERVKDAVLSRDETDLRAIFQNSTRLNKIRIEPFDAAKHKNLRRGGRVLVPDPRSFPLDDQGQLAAYLKQKQKNVGQAKAGWAQCSAQLGKTVPAWLNKSGAGQVTDESAREENPYVVLSNKIGFFAALDSKANIVSRALEGRGRDMIRSAEKQLEEAARKAGLS